MKTIGGYRVIKFKKLDKPKERGNLSPMIYSGIVMVPGLNDSGEHEVFYDEQGKCANPIREDCYIDPKFIDQYKTDTE